ncbi:MAG: J domain-containing protein [Crocinitomicaceae bacterium]
MSHNPFNAYQLLEISSIATEIEIKKAFKIKALEFHPDKHQNGKPATVLFNILVQAKEILLDPEKRLEHDYAHGIKLKPSSFEETLYRSEPIPKTDWGSLLVAGIAGLALGATVLRKKRSKK